MSRHVAAGRPRSCLWGGGLGVSNGPLAANSVQVLCWPRTTLSSVGFSASVPPWMDAVVETVAIERIVAPLMPVWKFTPGRSMPAVGACSLVSSFKRRSASNAESSRNRPLVRFSAICSRPGWVVKVTASSTFPVSRIFRIPSVPLIKPTMSAPIFCTGPDHIAFPNAALLAAAGTEQRFSSEVAERTPFHRCGYVGA